MHRYWSEVLKRVDRLSVAAVIAVIVLWAVLSNFVFRGSVALPSPQSLWQTFVELARNGYGNRPLLDHIGTSMGRALSGFALAAISSTVIGLVIGYSSTARSLFMPFIDFLRPVPALALIPIFVFFFGIGSLSKVALIFLGAFIYMTLQTSEGVRNIPKDLFAAGESLELRGWQMFCHVILPGTLPAIATGMRTALSLSWALVVAAELIAAPSGLGYIITNATEFFQIRVVYVTVAILAVVGFTMDRIIVFLMGRIIHWQGK